MFTRIRQALTANHAPDKLKPQFVYEHSLNPQDVQIDVSGFGRLPFPVTETVIQPLLKQARLAQVGHREKTLLDTRIRNTYEISAEQLQVNYDKTAMTHLLNAMRIYFGLSEQVQLSAHVHNLLIYGPGQFFDFHQDTEKLEGMVATLVIILPSPHIGGDLIINHQHKTHRFVSENLNNSTLPCVAFYADCQHAVETVKQGYRLALTFNVVLQTKKQDGQDTHFQNTQLTHALEDYFKINEPSSSTPIVFNYFLAHQYSAQGLSWERLKGADAQQAMALRQAAQQLNLIPHLALVEIHESWITEDEEDNPKPCELIDGCITLSHWLDEQGQVLPYQDFYVSDDEFCCATDIKAQEPDEKEYEGWLGNYGNTVDYWYRRAAVVLWRANDHTAMLFQLNYKAAFESLMALTKTPGAAQAAQRRVQQAGEYLHRSNDGSRPKELQAFMKLAHYIQHPQLAHTVLQPFELAQLNVQNIPTLYLLQTHYGIQWCLKLMKTWRHCENQFPPHRECLIRNIDSLAKKAKQVRLAESLIRFLILYQLQQLTKKDNEAKKYLSPLALQNSAAERNSASTILLNAIFIFDNGHAIVKKWLAHLLSNTELYDVAQLSTIYLTLKKNIPAHYQAVFTNLITSISKTIRQELKQGLRDANDWSIQVDLNCDCEQSQTLTTFLRSPTESKKIWPIAQHYRDHITQQLSELGLPIHLSTRKKGSPYQLVLEKTPDLYQAAKQRFNQLTLYSRRLKAASVC